MADGLKVLKHHRRSSKKAASRVIRYVPDYGGALVWDKPLRQPGAKASRVPLDAINQVELEVSAVFFFFFRCCHCCCYWSGGLTVCTYVKTHAYGSGMEPFGWCRVSPYKWKNVARTLP